MSIHSTTMAEASAALYQHFLSHWDPGYNGAPSDQALTAYCFDNEQLSPETPWVRFSVRHLDNGQTTLSIPGRRKFERRGRCFIQLFCLPNQGRAQTDELLPSAVNVFEGRPGPAGTTIRFKEVIPRERGLVEQDRWYASTVEAVFEYDELK